MASFKLEVSVVICSGSSELSEPRLLIMIMFNRAKAVITCAIITLCTLLPCNFISDGCFEYWCSSLAQLRVQDTEKQRRRRCDDTRLAESGNARSEQLLVMPVYTNRLRMVSGRDLEWIATFKGPVV